MRLIIILNHKFSLHFCMKYLVNIGYMTYTYHKPCTQKNTKERYYGMIDIEALKSLNQLKQISVTEHARIRLIERGIVIDDIINCIRTGKIIKQYEDDKPFPSCLILGASTHNTPIHIVASTDDEYIYLITAYYPDNTKWESDFKTRKEH